MKIISFNNVLIIVITLALAFIFLRQPEPSPAETALSEAQADEAIAQRITAEVQACVDKGGIPSLLHQGDASSIVCLLRDH